MKVTVCILCGDRLINREDKVDRRERGSGEDSKSERKIHEEKKKVTKHVHVYLEIKGSCRLRQMREA